MDSLLSDEDIKDKGNKEMYLNVFDGKRNRATVQRGYSVGGDIGGFDIG